MSGVIRSAVILTTVVAAPACGGDWARQGTPGSGGSAGTGGVIEERSAPTGLHAAGSFIVDEDGNEVILRGVNRSGSEYSCTKSAGVFDGESSERSVQAMRSWRINAVRIPLNEGCWRAGPGISSLYSGDAYKTAILDYVALLQRYGIVPILDLHWSRPGDDVPLELMPMPNAEHTPEFWRDVATTFKDNTGVIFEPFNEPYPDRNMDSDAAWDCWLNGCLAVQWDETEGYEAVGMQVLVDAIRDTGATQLILLGGIEYSNGLSQWLAHKPVDPLENLGAAWHAYDFNGCSFRGCWDAEPGTVIAEVPIVATEIGQSNCTGQTFLEPLMTWLDERRIGYLAWTWNVQDQPCLPRAGRSEGMPWGLVSSYTTPTPFSGYATTFHDHLARVVVE